MADTLDEAKAAFAKLMRRSNGAGSDGGTTNRLLVVAYGFDTKMLARLVHEGLAMAVVGEGVEAGDKPGRGRLRADDGRPR